MPIFCGPGRKTLLLMGLLPRNSGPSQQRTPSYTDTFLGAFQRPFSVYSNLLIADIGNSRKNFTIFGMINLKKELKIYFHNLKKLVNTIFFKKFIQTLFSRTVAHSQLWTPLNSGHYSRLRGCPLLRGFTLLHLSCSITRVCFVHLFVKRVNNLKALFRKSEQ